MASAVNRLTHIYISAGTVKAGIYCIVASQIKIGPITNCSRDNFVVPSAMRA